MEDLKYKQNKIEEEMLALNKKRKNYLKNIKKNRISKRNMILNPILPIIAGGIGCGVYTLVCKTLPTIEVMQLMGIAVLTLECVGFEEELQQIINYQDSKTILKETSLEEIEKEMSLKEKEKAKLVEEKTNSIVDNHSLSNNDKIFEARDLYLDSTMHFLNETEDKVLVKKIK